MERKSALGEHAHMEVPPPTPFYFLVVWLLLHMTTRGLLSLDDLTNPMGQQQTQGLDSVFDMPGVFSYLP